MSLLEVRDLSVRFGTVEAVSGLNLTATLGGSVALVGRNGAGKSTTLRALAGVVPPSRGQILLDGHDAGADPDLLRASVGYCPDVGGLIPRATPWEHLQLAAQLRRLPAGWEQRAHLLLERFDLSAAADRVTAGFSHGMGRRTSVVLACFHEPRLLLLDEPFDGVDPLGVDATLEVIQEATERGAAVLISTHLIELASQACSEIVVLKAGRLVAHEEAERLRGNGGAARYRELLS